MSKLKEIKISTKETVENSSIHALPNIVRNKYTLIKLVWIVCFLISFGVCCWFIIQSIHSYLNYDVVTNIQVKYENKIKFPVVTICNLNYFATNYSYLVMNALFNSTNPPMELNYFAKVLSNFYISNFGLEKNKLGFGLEQTIIGCFYMLKDCNMTNDFEEYFDSWYGRCFRFNSGKNMLNQTVDQRYVYQSGLFGTLDLDLFIGSIALNDKPFSTQNGFKIFINDEIVNTFWIDGIQVSTGQSITISLDKTKIKKIPKPYSECTNDLTDVDSYNSEFYKKLFRQRNDSTYQLAACEALCIQKYVGDKCGCQSSLSEYFFYENMRICDIPYSNLTDYDAFMEYTCEIDAIFGYANIESDKRDCDCPLKCESSKYSYTISSSEYPSMQLYTNYFSQLYLNDISSMSYNDLRQSIAKVQIYFQEMKQTVIEENEKTLVSDLVSNIGGTLGLFLGCLTIVICNNS